MRIAVASVILIVLTISMAWRYGGSPERAAAITLAAMLAAEPVVHMFGSDRYDHVDLGHLIIDLAAWAAFLAIALIARRFWPLCVSSLQTIALVAHFSRAVDSAITPLAYAILKSGYFYVVVALIIVGAIREHIRVRRYGSAPSWRDLSQP